MMTTSVTNSRSHTYRLRHPSVASLPGGHRVGVIHADANEIWLAFLGSDPGWSGGRALRRGESFDRAGLHLTYVGGEFCPRSGSWIAELCCEAELAAASRAVHWCGVSGLDELGRRVVRPGRGADPDRGRAPTGLARALHRCAATRRRTVR